MNTETALSELYDRTSEIAVVAYAMDTPTTLTGEYVGRLAPSDFHYLDARLAFEACREAASQNIVPLPIVILPIMQRRLQESGLEWELPDFFALTEWQQRAVYAPEAEAHAQRLLKFSEARNLKAKLERAVKIVHDPNALSQPLSYLTLALQSQFNELSVTVPSLDEFTADELEASSGVGEPFLVDGIIQDSGVNLLWGKGGIGKSLIALDLGLKTATQGFAFGKQVNRSGGVLYLGADVDKRTMRDRLHRMRTALGLTDSLPGFTFVRAPLDFSDPAMFAYILHKAEAVGASHPSGRCALIVIDALSSYLSHLDENSNSDIAGVMNRLRLLADRTGAAILVVHHVAKNDLATGVHKGRGASALPNAADVVLELGDKNGTRIVSHAKSRNCAPMEPLQMQIVDEDDGQSVAIVYCQATGREVGAYMAELAADAMAAFVQGRPGESIMKREVLEAAQAGNYYSQRTLDRAWGLLRTMPGFVVGHQGRAAAVVYKPPQTTPETEPTLPR